MSSSSSYTNQYSQYTGSEECYCGRRIVMRTSMTLKNPGRRFLGCVNFKKRNGCKYFFWVDPETCPRGLEYAKIMDARNEELWKQVEALKMKNDKLEEENDALVVKIAELTELNVNLQAQIGSGQIGKCGSGNTWLYFVEVVLVVVAVFVSGVAVLNVNCTPKTKTLYLP